MRKSQETKSNKSFKFKLPKLPKGGLLNKIKKSSMGITISMNTKLGLTLGVVVLALILLAGKIFFLQKNNEKKYNEKILQAQNYSSKVIPFKRGDILDRNGTYIAKSEKMFRLILDPKSVIEPSKDFEQKTKNEKETITNTIEQTANLLNEVFGYNVEEVKKLFWDESTNAYIIYNTGLTYEEKVKFEKRAEEIKKENKKKGVKGGISGVWFEDYYVRAYPYGDVACDIIGFSNTDGNQGTGGIEQFYNEYLSGTSGREYGYLNEVTSVERTIKQPTNGSNAISTIDMNIQTIVDRHIKQREEEVGSKRTAVIIMDPNSGEILALATSKGYDLNNPRDLSRYYSAEEISAMNDATQLEALGNMWRNFAVSDTFEPGSPSKVFTMSAALEENIINGTENFFCTGLQEVQGQPIKCAVRAGHGEIDMQGALIQSCNMVMLDLAFKLGTEKFAKYQRVFGFGSKTGIDLPGEADTSGLIRPAESMMTIDLATNSFGQNYNCTMIQTAAAFCSAINGGTYYEPHVVKKIIDSNGSLKKNIQPRIVRETVSQKTSEFLREALRRAVAEGTGAAAQVAGYDIGGKTGTAEKYPRKDKNYLVSFAGFAPANNPEVFCYVIIDEPRVEDQAHSTYASSLFASIMAEVLPAMNIFPNTQTTEENSKNQGLPENEGIVQTETKVYETDEFIPRDDSFTPDSSLPATETTADSGLNVIKSESSDQVYQTKEKTETTKENASETTGESASESATENNLDSPSGDMINNKEIKAPTAQSIEETVAPK